jgi:hypothetical protein
MLPLQDSDEISVAHGREPVGDHDCGPLLHKFVQRFLDLLFGLGIDRGGSLIKYEDR